MICVPLQQTVLKATEPKEVVLFFEILDNELVDWAQVAGQQLVIGVVLLAGDAILALVEIQFDVAGVVAALKQFGHADLVTLLGRSDEVVVGDIQFRPGICVQRCNRVDKGLWFQTRLVGRLLHLLAVLVGAGQKVNVITRQAVPACQGIADDCGVRMPEMRLCGDVVDRGCQVGASHRGSFT